MPIVIEWTFTTTSKTHVSLFLEYIEPDSPPSAISVQSLEALSLVKTTDDNVNNIQLAQITEIPSWTTTYEPIYGGTPPLWRMAINHEDRSKEELVVTVQGILYKKDIPPFQEKISSSGNHNRYLCQSITLAGYETPTFQKIIKDITEMHALMNRSIGGNRVDQCEIIGQYDGNTCLEIYNRYFTPRRDAPHAQEISLSNDIDPHGYLKAAAGMQLIHCDENVVVYFEMTTSKDGNVQYMPIKPVKFQIGDIVEVLVSIVAVPIRDKKMKTVMVLHGLTLLDGSFSQAASVARISKQVMQSSNLKVSTLKRRVVGYVDDEVAATCSKLSRMEIDDRAQDDRSESSSSKANEMISMQAEF